MTDTPPKPKRRRWRWLAAWLLLLASCLLAWWGYVPRRIDPRFIGTWQVDAATRWRLGSDGRFSISSDGAYKPIAIWAVAEGKLHAVPHVATWPQAMAIKVTNILGAKLGPVWPEWTIDSISSDAITLTNTSVGGPGTTVSLRRVEEAGQDPAAPE